MIIAEIVILKTDLDIASKEPLSGTSDNEHPTPILLIPSVTVGITASCLIREELSTLGALSYCTLPRCLSGYPLSPRSPSATFSNQFATIAEPSY